MRFSYHHPKLNEWDLPTRLRLLFKRPSDADDVEEISRLHSASYVLRLLARFMISQELGVSDQIYSGD